MQRLNDRDAVLLGCIVGRRRDQRERVVKVSDVWANVRKNFRNALVGVPTPNRVDGKPQSAKFCNSSIVIGIFEDFVSVASQEGSLVSIDEVLASFASPIRVVYREYSHQSMTPIRSRAQKRGVSREQPRVDRVWQHVSESLLQSRPGADSLLMR